MTMQKHFDAPGSAEWHARRAGCYNAGDAPAALGCSPNKTRTQLLDQLATGIEPEFTDYVQTRVLDRGHRIEEQMRPIAEEILGEELYVFGGSLPVEGLSRPLGASYDGVNMSEDANWECKSLNAEIRAALPHDGRDSAEFNNAAALPKVYRVQMEQQQMVNGAARTLFSAGNIDKHGKVTEERHAWYLSDPVLRAEIIPGWKQLEADRAAHVPAQVKERPPADVVSALPALVIHAKGEITTSNMKEYGVALAERLAHVRSIALVTDQDFSNAKAGAALLRKEIVTAQAVKAAMLQQTLTVGEAASLIDTWCEDMRVTALQLEKDVEREDIAKKAEMMRKAKAAYEAHIEALKVETGGPWIALTPPSWPEAIRSKRSYTNMQDALDTMLANAKIAADGSATKIRAALAALDEEAKGYEHLFADRLSFISKPVDDVRALAKGRIAERRAAEAAKEEAQRARIAAEEKAKAEAAVQEAKAEEDSLIAGVWRQARRVEGESVEYIQKAITQFGTVERALGTDSRPRVAAAVAEASAELKAKLDAATARAQQEAEARAAQEDRRPAALVAEVQPAMFCCEKGEAQGLKFALCTECGDASAAYQADMAPVRTAPAPSVVQMPVRAAAPAPAVPQPLTKPTLRLGVINERLATCGISTTAEGLRLLGFAHVEKDRSALLYHERDWPHMLAAMVQRIEAITATAAA